MNRKVTQEELEELYEFCFFRSVMHYDIQVELVDHLATAIEELWKTNPALSFQKALEQVDQQFGGHAGFVVIRQEKEKATRKKYRRLLWQFVGEYYKFPKFVITFCLFVGLFTALKFTENNQWVVFAFVISFFTFWVFYFMYYFPKYIKIKVHEKYSFLLNQIIIEGFTGKAIMLSGGFLGGTIHVTNLSNIGSLVFSAFASLFIVLVYADCFFIPKKIHEHFEAQFPNLKLV